MSNNEESRDTDSTTTATTPGHSPKRISQDLIPPWSFDTLSQFRKNLWQSDSKLILTTHGQQQEPCSDPLTRQSSFSSTAQNEKFSELSRQLFALQRDSEQAKKALKANSVELKKQQKNNTDLSNKTAKMKNSIEDMEKAIKASSMRHIEVLGVFSSLLALLISSASIASHATSLLSACILLAMMSSIAIIMIATISNVVHNRHILDIRNTWHGFLLVVIILFLACFDPTHNPTK